MKKIKKDPATAKKQGLIKRNKYNNSTSKKQISSQQHVENKRIIKNDKTISSNLLFLIDKLESEINSSRFILIKNDFAVRSHDSYLSNLKNIRKNLLSLPRYDWQLIQNKIDSLYAEDKSLTGFIIQFDFKESKNPNRATIKHFHNGN